MWTSPKMVRGAVMAVLLGVTGAGETTVNTIELPAEVLEGGEVNLGDKRTAVSYSVVHHHNDADHPRLSDWLHAHSGEMVMVRMPDGQEHRATLHRLTHCSSRGLLL